METALEFELNSFIDSAERKKGANAWEVTARWLRAAAARSRPPLLAPSASFVVETAVCDGLLDLIFRPPTPAESTARRQRSKSGLLPAFGPAPSPLVVPETLQLDVFRLQAFHSDVTDLAVVYAILMLYRQLAGARATESEVDRVRREIWALVASNPVAEGVANLSISSTPNHGPSTTGPGLGLKKLECEAWRQGINDVLLQVAARAQAEAFPDPATLELVYSWGDTNLRANAPLFVMLAQRLRTTLAAVLVEHLDADRAGQGWWPQAAAAAAMASTSLNVAGHEVGACGRGHGPVTIAAAHMAASTPSPSRPRKRRSDSVDSNTSSKRARSTSPEPVEEPKGPTEFERHLVRNGLSPLEGEVRLLGERIAKVAGFHLRVYSGWYENLLGLPIPQ